MKTSLTKLRSSIVLAILVSLPTWAKPIAQVTDVSGQVFAVTPDGKTITLKLNDHIDEKSEVMVEEGATVTLNDYFDATYHLIGGTHIKFFNKSVQLKRGKTWILSKGTNSALALTTANGHVDFSKAEFITTFDQATSRSQILVVNGDVEVSNVLDSNTKITAQAGTFTLVDPEIENGVPRSPTKVGLASLNSSLAEFKKLPTKMKEVEPSRSIASVTEEKKKGEIIFITTNRLPASVQGSAHSYYKKNTKKGLMLKSAPIKFYGILNNQVEAAPRNPASVPVVQSTVPNALPQLKRDTEFDESLKTQSAEQPKYSKELESLINDLKSY